jgi:hypothetical protein
MPLVKQGGENPYSGQVTTTMGMRKSKAPLCVNCRQRKEGELYTLSPNGQELCPDCAGSMGRGVLTPDMDSRFDVLPEVHVTNVDSESDDPA